MWPNSLMELARAKGWREGGWRVRDACSLGWRVVLRGRVGCDMGGCGWVGR